MARDYGNRSMDEILAGQACPDKGRESLRIWREMLDVLKRMTLELHRIADNVSDVNASLEKAARVHPEGSPRGEAKGEDGH